MPGSVASGTLCVMCHLNHLKSQCFLSKSSSVRYFRVPSFVTRGVGDVTCWTNRIVVLCVSFATVAQAIRNNAM
jgi:hypothetical protein